MVATPEKPQYKVIGTRPIRPDGTDKVIGRAEYGIDVRLPGMLYGRIKRSPYAHAIIKRIDASKALALPGVKAVITHDDFPPPGDTAMTMGEGGVSTARFMLEGIMASKKVLYRGQPVAAVCATDHHIAEDALELIEVEYEPLPVVSDVREAMSDAAPVLHENLRTRDMAPLSQTPSDKPTNIASHLRFARGDVQAGFAAADIVVEREFETSMFHQGYIEPHNGTAFWNRDGKLTVWCSTQGSFSVRANLATLLQIPVSQINVIPMEIGGGFGGKLVVYLEPIAAVFSKITGKPVKMMMTRDEVFEATGPTSGTYIRVKMGAKKDGTLTAAEVYLAYEAGAFPGSPVGAGATCALAPYDIENYVIDGYDVVVNKPKTAAYRAPGAPAAEFAVESVVNEIAKQLDIDPIDLRLKNAAKEGTPRPTGQKFGRIGAVEVMQAMKDHPHYKSEIQGPDRGRGVAMGFWGNVGGERSATAAINPDGTIKLVVGNVDIGGTRAAMAMMLAETLGISAEQVHPHVVGTDDIGATGLTGGSSSAFAIGWTMYELGLELRKKLTERAARIWEVPEDQVTYGDDGVIRGPADAEGKPREMSFKEIAGRLARTGGAISAGLTTQKQGAGPAYGGHIVDVEVDRETGKVTILRYTAVQDVGTAIHPSYVEGQIQGGVAQGVGMALTEEYYWGPDGRMQNASFLDYRMPTTLDLPMIDTVLVEVPNPGHPYGVRGVGEVPIVPPMPAIQAAIADAIGVNLYKAPMSPRVVLEALLDKER
ncbi:MAG TPA: xanthine dehydrogenase family protein molybdopterin-binding subunit [Dehalococcoidia bacterium]|nr:xanthine dehydrogenase family protein molybdopterin-binding subunit [Dehalococcoidia bacterium]